MNTRFPAARSATLTACPAVTGVLLSVRLPDVGNVVITTAMKLLGGESWGSVNPSRRRQHSGRRPGSSRGRKGRLTCWTWIVAVATLLSGVPSLASYWKLSVPLK